MYLGIPTQRLGLEEDQSATSGSGTSAGPGSSTLPYREALEETERKQREEYERDCANSRSGDSGATASFTQRKSGAA